MSSPDDVVPSPDRAPPGAPGPSGPDVEETHDTAPQQAEGEQRTKTGRKTAIWVLIAIGGILCTVLLVFAPSSRRENSAAEAHFKRGVAHQKHGEYDAAIRELKKAIA